MDENKSPADRLLDLVVFGPAGLALTATEEFPKLVDKGRHHLEGQVRTARLVGQVAFQMGRRQFDQFVGQRSSKPAATSAPAPAVSKAARPVSPERVTPKVVSEGSTTAASDAAAPAETTTTANGPATANKTAGTNGSSVTNGAPTKAATKSTPVNGAVADGSVAGSLAIPGYDSLSASQVVQRLAGLSRAELIEVRAHEQAQRHRRTILNRVEQLLAGVDAE
ncbi:MAG TPA: hypothetical protein VIJ09_00460 [Acidimicrobiales bacterium]|jgi:hypothetical protein